MDDRGLYKGEDERRGNRPSLLIDPLVAKVELAEEAQKDYEAQHARTTQLVWRKHGDQHSLMLKEPRQLFSTNRDPPIHASQPRWPFEMPCINVRPQHISYLPPAREAFYNRAVDDFPHRPSKPYNKPKLVYYTPLFTEPNFVRARAGASPIRELKPVAISPQGESETLVFEARFECGNLQQVTKVGPHDYELYLRHDLYTKKHTQWFYFRIQNTRADTAYRFTIMNLLKPASLYNEGLKPVFYSEKDANSRGIGWVHNGAYISYYKNTVRRADNADRFCYSLSWTSKLPYSNDTCYFAHCYPYTYTDLQDYLKRIASDPIRSRFCRQRILCHTIAGNYVHLLTVTSPSTNPIEAKEKRAVVVTARVHPGETNGSWMMKGFLDFICGPSADAKILRDCFVFKVIPMLNPDGVIVGNYRCSLAGRDLNRNYRTNYKEAYPGIWSCREMVKRLLKERDILVYCDFHGHSRKHNVFMYGCENKDNPLLRFHERVFPLILDKSCHGKFLYDSCHFKVQKSKEGTGRIVMWRAGILNSFTMEATYCGSRVDGPVPGYHFHSGDLESMGYHFCDAILDYCDPDPSKILYLLEELAERHRERIRQRLAQLGRDLPSDDDLLDMDIDVDLSSSDDGGSDSSGTDGEPIVAPTLLKEHVSNRADKRKRRKARREHAKAKVKLQFESKQQVTAVRESAATALPKAAHRAPPVIEQSECDSSVVDTEEKLDQPSSVPLTEKDIILKAGKPDPSPRHRSGAPVHTQERLDERAKRQVLGIPSQVYPQVEPQAQLNEYLTSLTNEYIRQGLLITERNKDIPHISYSTTTHRSSQVMRSALPAESTYTLQEATQIHIPHLEERMSLPKPPSKIATASVIDLPHRPPSPPSFTSQFLANQLREPLPQTQMKVNRFDGEFQPNLLSANSTTPRSLKQRGSKSTGALPTPMSPQAMLNLGHNVASRYDRSGIERTISDHKKQATPAASSTSQESANKATPPTIPATLGTGHEPATIPRISDADKQPSQAFSPRRDKTKYFANRARQHDGKTTAGENIERHKTAVKMAVAAVQQQKQAGCELTAERRRDRGTAATVPAAQAPTSRRSPEVNRQAELATVQKEIVPARSSIVPPLVTSCQPTRPTNRFALGATSRDYQQQTEPPASFQYSRRLQQQQRQQATRPEETTGQQALPSESQHAELTVTDMTLTPAVYRFDAPDGVMTPAPIVYHSKPPAGTSQPRQGRPFRPPTRTRNQYT